MEQGSNTMMDILEMREDIRYQCRVLWVLIVFVAIFISLQMGMMYDYKCARNLERREVESFYAQNSGRNLNTDTNNNEEKEWSFNNLGWGLIAYHFAVITVLFWAAFGIMEWLA